MSRCLRVYTVSQKGSETFSSTRSLVWTLLAKCYDKRSEDSIIPPSYNSASACTVLQIWKQRNGIFSAVSKMKLSFANRSKWKVFIGLPIRPTIISCQQMLSNMSRTTILSFSKTAHCDSTVRLLSSLLLFSTRLHPSSNAARSRKFIYHEVYGVVYIGKRITRS